MALRTVREAGDDILIKKSKEVKDGIILEDSKEKVKTKPFKLRTIKKFTFKDVRRILPECS